MTKHGPFDAAIELLDEYYDDDEVRSAIAVLEAAAKVDKEGCANWVEWAAESMDNYLRQGSIAKKFWPNAYTQNLQDIRGYENLIRALLSALPDATKGGDK